MPTSTSRTTSTPSGGGSTSTSEPRPRDREDDEADALSGVPRSRGRDPLLAAICHDLRAPLAAVTMGANFVLQTTPEAEASGRSRRVLQAILRSCKQMERLVRDFGDLSEIEADAVELRMGVHDTAQILEIAAEAARPNALARTVDIVVSAPKEPTLVRCDRERVLRALAHVLENAARFAPDGSAVELGVHERNDNVCFTVTDHGPGLSSETLENLYDRTWHGRRSDRVGAGLGLAIVRGFIVAHGGSIEVASKQGETTFTLIVPRDSYVSSRNVNEAAAEQ